jgi:hypothetical protein
MADDDNKIVLYRPLSGFLSGNPTEVELSRGSPLTARLSGAEGEPQPGEELTVISALDLALFDKQARNGSYIVFGDGSPGMAPVYTISGEYVSLYFCDPSRDITSYPVKPVFPGLYRGSTGVKTSQSRDLVHSVGPAPHEKIENRTVPNNPLPIPDPAVLETLEWGDPAFLDRTQAAYKKMGFRADGAVREGYLYIRPSERGVDAIVSNHFERDVLVKHTGSVLPKGGAKSLRHGDILQIGPVLTFRYWTVTGRP